MTWSKRAFDLALALLLIPMVAPAILLISIVILLQDGRPIFYCAERMRSPEHGFALFKFRTMIPNDRRSGVTGGDKINVITKSGRWLRRYRLDELPQILNVLRGDISFVGPRPPLRLYVEAEPELYAQVLRNRPGLTGLATLYFHRHEARILSSCDTPEATHLAYLRRCVPRKARLDMIYGQQQSVCLDAALLLRTFCAILRS